MNRSSTAPMSVLKILKVEELPDAPAPKHRGELPPILLYPERFDSDFSPETDANPAVYSDAEDEEMLEELEAARSRRAYRRSIIFVFLAFFALVGTGIYIVATRATGCLLGENLTSYDYFASRACNIPTDSIFCYSEYLHDLRATNVHYAIGPANAFYHNGMRMNGDDTVTSLQFELYGRSYEVTTVYSAEISVLTCGLMVTDRTAGVFYVSEPKVAFGPIVMDHDTSFWCSKEVFEIFRTVTANPDLDLSTFLTKCPLKGAFLCQNVL